MDELLPPADDHGFEDLLLGLGVHLAVQEAKRGDPVELGHHLGVQLAHLLRRVLVCLCSHVLVDLGPGCINDVLLESVEQLLLLVRLISMRRATCSLRISFIRALRVLC